MTPRKLTFLLMIAGCSLGWGADAQEALSRSRADYRQAVIDHGENSPQAKEARAKLRAARRTYHSTRRERFKNPSTDRSVRGH